jgi:hypothetical protein
MAVISDLKILRDQTWAALEVFDLDHNDSKCVIRYERLVKLVMALDKQLKSGRNKPETRPNALQTFLEAR